MRVVVAVIVVVTDGVADAVEVDVDVAVTVGVDVDVDEAEEVEVVVVVPVVVDEPVAVAVMVRVFDSLSDALPLKLTKTEALGDSVIEGIIDTELLSEVDCVGVTVIDGVGVALSLGNCKSNGIDRVFDKRPLPKRPSPPFPQHLMPCELLITAQVCAAPAVMRSTLLNTFTAPGCDSETVVPVPNCPNDPSPQQLMSPLSPINTQM